MQSITVKTPGVNDKATYEVIKRLKVKGEIVLALVKEDGTLDKDNTVTLKVTTGIASYIPLRTRYTLSNQNVSTYKVPQTPAKKAEAKAPAKAKTKPVVKAKPAVAKPATKTKAPVKSKAKPVTKTKAKSAVKAKKTKETVPADSFPAHLRSAK